MKTREQDLNIAVADYLTLQYPDVLFCHIANERKTSKLRGGKFKQMGVKSGMPDVMIFKTKIEDDEFGLKITPGLAIELKIKPNTLTENQQEILQKLKKENWLTKVCYSFDEAKEFIDSELNKNHNDGLDGF